MPPQPHTGQGARSLKQFDQWSDAYSPDLLPIHPHPADRARYFFFFNGCLGSGCAFTCVSVCVRAARGSITLTSFCVVVLPSPLPRFPSSFLSSPLSSPPPSAFLDNRVDQDITLQVTKSYQVIPGPVSSTYSHAHTHGSAAPAINRPAPSDPPAGYVVKPPADDTIST